MTGSTAPSPELRVVKTEQLFAHEDHDTQRSRPLIERMSTEAHIINPPIVAPMYEGQYVILDGANRVFAFSELGYPHILVQVVSYDSGFVQLKTWHHVICRWTPEAILQHIEQVPDVTIADEQHPDAIAHVHFRDGRLVALLAHSPSIHERNRALRHFVSSYQRNAILHRTALDEPDANWSLHPDGVALVYFPSYRPADIMAAAQHHAFLPAGVSRHIVQGRAIRVNFPIHLLRDSSVSLDEKNARLQQWIQDKVGKRQVRYYAEATYQFDE